MKKQNLENEPCQKKNDCVTAAFCLCFSHAEVSPITLNSLTVELKLQQVSGGGKELREGDTV